MRRGPIAAFVVMGLALVGCGAATITESGPLAVRPAQTPIAEDGVAVAPPRPMMRNLRAAGGLSTDSVAVPDGETARVFTPAPVPVTTPTAASDVAAPRLGPALPKPAGPAFPTTEQVVATPAAVPVNVYSYITTSHLSPAVADVPLRAYVPNSDAGTVSVIDPSTMKVIDRFAVGTRPHHVTPSWDLTKLYVNNTESNSLTVIDPRTGRPTGTIPITDPYNLYFTPDGSKAIVVAERFQRLDFYDASSWTFIKSVGIPWPGVDHADFSADGRYFLASTEFSGQVVKVDTQTMTLAGRAEVGGLPIDVKLSPDGTVLYVANQGRNGVSIVDVESMTEIGFLRTGVGAHGLNVSRDAATLYVSNRMDGSISIIDFATRTVRDTWRVGGSPDMIQISADGSQLWVSNRFQGSVSVVDTASGKVTNTIATGAGAHGVSLFPQPGRFNVGHNGVYR
jgi:YVTN family beta-propeller protein